MEVQSINQTYTYSSKMGIRVGENAWRNRFWERGVLCSMASVCKVVGWGKEDLQNVTKDLNNNFSIAKVMSLMVVTSFLLPLPSWSTTTACFFFLPLSSLSIFYTHHFIIQTSELLPNQTTLHSMYIPQTALGFCSYCSSYLLTINISWAPSICQNLWST